ncbi:MAG TPA: hypothetical protein VGI68_26350 [Mycobacterium sp.]
MEDRLGPLVQAATHVVVAEARGDKAAHRAPSSVVQDDAVVARGEVLPGFRGAT